MKNFDIRDPAAVLRTGMKALSDALGPVGTLLFLQQFRGGKGDYTKERQEWIDQWDIDAIVRQAEELRKEQSPEAPTEAVADREASR
jgi:hypothetical protein